MDLKVTYPTRNPGLKVKFDTTKPLTIKSSTASRSTLTTLTDVDASKAEASLSGATLVYDSETQTYKSEKVFNYDGDDVSLDGGTF